MKARGLPPAAVLILGIAGLLVGAAGPGPVTNAIGMTLVRSEPGTFRRSSPPSRDTWEEPPARDVDLATPFLISETEVTVERVRRFRPGFLGTPSFEPYPAGVGCEEASALAEWLDVQLGVKEFGSAVTIAADPARPYLRGRSPLPAPFDESAAAASGLAP